MNNTFNPEVAQYLYARANERGIPLGGTFELTPRCNMNCRMCYIRMSEAEMREKGSELSVSEWLELASQAQQKGMLFLLLTGGEPLLYPGFKELFCELKKLGLMISINTNATMLNDDVLEFFKKYPPYRLNITVYGGSNDTYKRLCRCNDGYDRATSAIRKLRDANFFVKINGSITPENIDDAEEILGVAKDYSSPCSLGCYMFPPVRRDGKSTCRFEPDEAGRRQAGIDYYRYDDISFANEISKIKSVEETDLCDAAAEKFRCRAGRSSFWITWDGRMNACGMMDTFSLHPLDDGFEACWSKINREISAMTVLDGCKTCKNRAICKVCPAVAAAETGDVNKKPEYLCEMLEAWKEEMLLIDANRPPKNSELFKNRK